MKYVCMDCEYNQSEGFYLKYQQASIVHNLFSTMNRGKNQLAHNDDGGDNKQEKQHERRTLNPSVLSDSNSDVAVQARTANSEVFKPNDGKEKTAISPRDLGSLDRYRQTRSGIADEESQIPINVSSNGNKTENSAKGSRINKEIKAAEQGVEWVLRHKANDNCDLTEIVDQNKVQGEKRKITRSTLKGKEEQGVEKKEKKSISQGSRKQTQSKNKRSSKKVEKDKKGSGPELEKKEGSKEKANFKSKGKLKVEKSSKKNQKHESIQKTVNTSAKEEEGAGQSDDIDKKVLGKDYSFSKPLKDKVEKEVVNKSAKGMSLSKEKSTAKDPKKKSGQTKIDSKLLKSKDIKPYEGEPDPPEQKDESKSRKKSTNKKNTKKSSKKIS